MQQLLEAIRGRLDGSRYVNEASISVGIVTPLLNALGWDSADLDQLVPEYSIPERGRVDFALLGLAGKPRCSSRSRGSAVHSTAIASCSSTASTTVCRCAC